MKLKAEILGVETVGDMVQVTCQCQHSGADYLPLARLVFDAPTYRASTYHVGGKLDVEIAPRRKRTRKEA